jgi:hypothetical protein
MSMNPVDVAEDLLLVLPGWEARQDIPVPLAQLLGQVRELCESIAEAATQPAIPIHELRGRRISQQASVNTLELLLLRLANADTLAEQRAIARDALTSSHNRGVTLGQGDVERMRSAQREAEVRASRAEESALEAQMRFQGARLMYLRLRRGDLDLAEMPPDLTDALAGKE